MQDIPYQLNNGQGGQGQCQMEKLGLLFQSNKWKATCDAGCRAINCSFSASLAYDTKLWKSAAGAVANFRSCGTWLQPSVSER